MFGYVRPLQPEMKVSELASFKACYCGLCRTLGKKYGFFSRFILNYDFTFLSMLLWEESDELTYCKHCCPASWCRKKWMIEDTQKLDRCAAYSLILFWWKCADTISDDSFIKKTAARVARLFLKRGYLKAKNNYPAFDESVNAQLRRLTVLEKNRESGLDFPADCFAALLSSAADDETDPERKRILSTILYHLGRWIYLIDAYDDLSEDCRRGNYNPIALRFDALEGKLADQQKEELKETLQLSKSIVSASYELLAKNVWSSILDNIIYLGLNKVERDVFSGTFSKKKERRPI